MSLTVLPAVTGCVAFETAQQIAFSQSGRQPSQKWLWLAIGISCYLSELIFWLWLLTTLPLSIATPLMAANYITVSLASYLLFKEPLDVKHWIGITFIVAGIYIISQGYHG